MKYQFARVLIEMPNGKTKEFRPGEGTLNIVHTSPSGSPGSTPATVHYVEFVARVEEEEL